MSDAEPLLLAFLGLGERKPSRKRAAELAVPDPSGHTVGAAHEGARARSDQQARATQMSGMCDRDLAPILADLPSVWAERSEGVLRIMGCSTVAPLSPPRCAFDDRPR